MVEPLVKKPRLTITTSFSIFGKNSSSVKDYFGTTSIHTVLLDPGSITSILAYKRVKNNSNVRKKKKSNMLGYPCRGYQY